MRAVLITLGLLGSMSTAAVAEEGLEVKLVSITSPVHPGNKVILVVQTEPAAACEGQRQGHFGQKILLVSRTAGDDGLVSWNWQTLAGSHPVGNREVIVTCTTGNRKGSLKTLFDVSF